MKLSTANFSSRAFTLVELMFAMVIGLAVAGPVLLLLFQTATEQRKGLVSATVEENAYVLESKLAICLHSASSDLGITPDYSSQLTDTNGTGLGFYKSIFFFTVTNGINVRANIKFDSTSGSVVYTPNVLTTAGQSVWMTNGLTTKLTKLWFSPGKNLDGSGDASLVNVILQMDDNGFSNQRTNTSSVYRNFSVQIRND